MRMSDSAESVKVIKKSFFSNLHFLFVIRTFFCSFSFHHHSIAPQQLQQNVRREKFSGCVNIEGKFSGDPINVVRTKFNEELNMLDDA